jgi:hypothetical protein
MREMLFGGTILDGRGMIGCQNADFVQKGNSMWKVGEPRGKRSSENPFETA